MDIITKVHLHEAAAALIAVICWLAIAGLAVAETDVPDILQVGATTSLAYVFGTRASTTIERLNGPRNSAPTPPPGGP
jgi:hypothetical protein